LALSGNAGGSNNIAIGVAAGASLTGDNNICIGSNGQGGRSNAIFIGNYLHSVAIIAGVYGRTTISNATLPVIVSNDGQLGTMSSSRRFKKEIKPMAQTSEAILALKPVTFHYKSDNTGTPQFGLIAEDVAAVNPDLVVRDEKGEIYSVRYDAVN